MSLQLSDTTNFRGLAQLFEREVGYNQGDVTGDTSRLKHFVADANLAWDDYLAIALTASGTWQFDDSNHADYPIIKTNLVDGQKDYAFTTDEQGNLILDIYKVAILPSATATLYQEIYPIDQQSPDSGLDLVSETTAEGVPTEYDKTANALFLTPTPSYSATNGLKVYINREASYFTYTDTTKKPGCPGLHHAYFYLKPALEYARRNNLANERKIKERVEELEKSIKEYFGKRSKDEKPTIKPKKILYI